MSRSRESPDFSRNTRDERDRRSRADSKGLLSRRAPFARALIFPKESVKTVTMRLVSLHSTDRRISPSLFSSVTAFPFGGGIASVVLIFFELLVGVGVLGGNSRLGY